MPCIIRQLYEILTCWNTQGQSCQCFLFSVQAAMPTSLICSSKEVEVTRTGNSREMKAWWEAWQKGTEGARFDHKLCTSLHLLPPAFQSPTCAKHPSLQDAPPPIIDWGCMWAPIMWASYLFWTPFSLCICYENQCSSFTVLVDTLVPKRLKN